MGSNPRANDRPTDGKEKGDHWERKKNLEWYSRLGTIEIEESTYRKGRRGKKLRPFSTSAEVSFHSYSQPLEKVIVDFGADVPFHKIPSKMEEHHGITVPVSSARKITLEHGERIGCYQQAVRSSEIPDSPGAPCVIAEADGSMVPIVVIAEVSDSPVKVDRRTTRQLQWREARLSLAHEKGSLEVEYAATMKDAEEAGQQLAGCAVQAGAGSQTQIHCVGDGATWIANQVDDKFGAQATYLIDFYHLCEYLEAAAKDIPGDSSQWLATQKQRMMDHQIRQVLNSLEMFMEEPDVPDDRAPLRACHRYINNRPGQFNYKQAKEDGLPIGSGEIESSHRHVIQDRLKRSGAWWTVENAQRMLDLRSLRASGDWKLYWSLTSLAA
ncbi:MAG: ISKra4 family transposase [Hyphomicrobiales bacterium]|nr:ISKra4 family transposase [Hyphomicrobiales bacterium]